MDDSTSSLGCAPTRCCGAASAERPRAPMPLTASELVVARIDGDAGGRRGARPGRWSRPAHTPLVGRCRQLSNIGGAHRRDDSRTLERRTGHRDGADDRHRRHARDRGSASRRRERNVAQCSTDGASDGRWLWIVALVLLGLETWLRRARREEAVDRGHTIVPPDVAELRAFLARASRRIAWIHAAEGAAGGVLLAIALGVVGWPSSSGSASRFRAGRSVHGGRHRASVRCSERASQRDSRDARSRRERRNAETSSSPRTNCRPARASSERIGAVVNREAARTRARLDLAALFPARNAIVALVAALGLWTATVAARASSAIVTPRRSRRVDIGRNHRRRGRHASLRRRTPDAPRRRCAIRRASRRSPAAA